MCGPRASPGGVRAPPTVLVVDGDPATCAALGRALDTPDLELELASSASDALRCLAQEPPPALALTAHGLPGMPGLDLLRAIAEGYPATRCVLCAAEVSLPPLLPSWLTVVCAPLDQESIGKIVALATCEAGAPSEAPSGEAT